MAAERRETASQLVLGAQTALLLWRAVHEGRLVAPEPVATDFDDLGLVTSYREARAVDLSSLGVTLTDRGLFGLYGERAVAQRCGPTETLARRLVPRGLAVTPACPMPLHLLCRTRSQRVAHPALRVHLMSGDVPPHALHRVSEGVLVTSPELALVQSCMGERVLPGIELALELCGTHALMPAGMSCRFDRTPVTSARRLASCLDRLGTRKGIASVRKALGFVCDGLASPREAEVYLLCTLPPDEGGFGLPRPLVNVTVPVGESPIGASSATGCYVVDLLWPEMRVVLEYDGLDEHESDGAKVAADKERRSVLAALGYTVIVITGRDMASAKRLEAKMSQVALALGVALPSFEGERAGAHAALLRWLCNPLHEHLPFGCGYH